MLTSLRKSVVIFDPIILLGGLKIRIHWLVSIIFAVVLMLVPTMTWASDAAPAPKPPKSQPIIPEIDKIEKRILQRASNFQKRKGLELSFSVGGEQTLHFNSQTEFVPASTVKLLTTALALETLGPDYRFLTDLEWYHREGSNTISHLKIYGGGDPTLGMKPFDRYPQQRIRTWAKELANQGVRKIIGPIEMISSTALEEFTPPDWAPTDLDLMACYGASALSFNFRSNCATLTISDLNKASWSDSAIKVPIYKSMKLGKRKRVLVDALLDENGNSKGYRVYGTWPKICAKPPVPPPATEPPPETPPKDAKAAAQGLGLLDRKSILVFDQSVQESQILNRVEVLTDDPKPPKQEPPKDCVEPDDPQLKKKVYVQLAIPNTKNWLKSQFIREARRAGIRWYSKTKPPQDLEPNGFQHYTIESWPLEKIVVVQNKKSHNLLSGAYFKAIGKFRNKDRQGSTLKAAQEAMKTAITNWSRSSTGKDTSESITIVDGAGLSLKNRSSSEALWRLLHSFSQQNYFDLLLTTLPIAGKDGTLQSRFVGTKAAHNVLAKTGTLTGHYQLAGYLIQEGANPHQPNYIPFVTFTKTPKSSRWRALRVQDRLVVDFYDWIAENPLP